MPKKQHPAEVSESALAARETVRDSVRESGLSPDTDSALAATVRESSVPAKSARSGL